MLGAALSAHSICPDVAFAFHIKAAVRSQELTDSGAGQGLRGTSFACVAVVLDLGTFPRRRAGHMLSEGGSRITSGSWTSCHCDPGCLGGVGGTPYLWPPSMAHGHTSLKHVSDTAGIHQLCTPQIFSARIQGSCGLGAVMGL